MGTGTPNEKGSVLISTMYEPCCGLEFEFSVVSQEEKAGDYTHSYQVSITVINRVKG